MLAAPRFEERTQKLQRGWADFTLAPVGVVLTAYLAGTTADPESEPAWSSMGVGCSNEEFSVQVEKSREKGENYFYFMAERKNGK